MSWIWGVSCVPFLKKFIWVLWDHSWIGQNILPKPHKFVFQVTDLYNSSSVQPQLAWRFKIKCGVPEVWIKKKKKLSSLAVRVGTFPWNVRMISTFVSPLPSGPFPFGSPGTPRMALGSPTGVLHFPSIQLLAIEMLLHFLMGPQVVDFAKQNKLVLSLGIEIL